MTLLLAHHLTKYPAIYIEPLPISLGAWVRPFATWSGRNFQMEYLVEADRAYLNSFFPGYVLSREEILQNLAIYIPWVKPLGFRRLIDQLDWKYSKEYTLAEIKLICEYYYICPIWATVGVSRLLQNPALYMYKAMQARWQSLQD